MPLLEYTKLDYKAPKNVQFEWDTFRKGLNSLLRENEIDNQELAQADNILLKGKGIPTKRWGTRLFFQAGETGQIRGLFGYYTSLGTTELLSITDDGYLVAQSNASYRTLTGASWASGYNAYMTQLDDATYIVNGQRELVRYSLPTLTGFPTIGLPMITAATNLSNATGSTIKGYRVSAISQVGETLASGTFEFPGQPETLGDPAGGTIRLFITTPSTASGVLKGINIYGRDSGNERFIGSLAGLATVFNDDGSAIPSEFTFPPTADSTGGPLAKYVVRFQDRLIFAGLSGEPSKVLISGRVPNHEKFDVSFGGNYILIEPDAGDDITGLVGFADRIVVFKEKSIWQITLASEQIGNFSVTTPQLKLVTGSLGCVAPRSIVPVENDVFFLSRNGVQTLGYESGFAFDTLRSNEISVKVREFFDNLTVSQKMNATAAYFRKKYIISFPGLDKSMVFDRERGAWVGPWTKDAAVFEVFYDTADEQRLVFGRDDSANVDEYSDAYIDDNGVAIPTILRTRQEDFGDWSLFKTINNLFLQFRNVTGEVNVDLQLETRDGAIISATNFTITPGTGDSGWAADIWASAIWGTSSFGGGGSDTSQLIRWVEVDKSARTIQVAITTTAVNSNYELLGIRGDAKPIGSGYRPSSWRV